MVTEELWRLYSGLPKRNKIMVTGGPGRHSKQAVAAVLLLSLLRLGAGGGESEVRVEVKERSGNYVSTQNSSRFELAKHKGLFLAPFSAPGKRVAANCGWQNPIFRIEASFLGHSFARQKV